MGCALQQRDRLCELKLGFENYLLACEKELTTEQMSTLSTLANLEKELNRDPGVLNISISMHLLQGHVHKRRQVFRNQ